MSGITKYVIGVLVYLFCSATVTGQQTAIYWEVNRDYKTALELFDVEDFVNARAIFEEIYSKTHTATDAELITLSSNAEYYNALSALKLLNPDGEKLMLDFIGNHTQNAKINIANYHLGNYYYRKKKYRNAIKHFEQTETGELSYQQAIDYKFQLGYAYFFNKDFHQAKPLFGSVRKVDQYKIPANYYHGFIAFTEGNYDEALSDFEVVESSNYYGKVVPFYITSIYFNQNKFDDVIAYGQELIENRSLKYYPEINQLVGKSYFEKGNYSDALPLLLYYSEAKHKLSKEDIYQLGYTQYKLGEFNDAIKNFKQLSREKDSIGQNALYLLGDSYIKTGDLKKARTALSEASNLNFDPVIKEHATFNYGKVSIAEGNHTTAIATLKEFVRKYPQSKLIPETRELLTDLFLSTRNYSEAIETIEAIPSKTPKIKKAYQKVTYYRGVELYNDRKFGNADQMFDKSLTQPVDAGIHAQVYFWKAEIKMQRPDYNGAIHDYNKFNSLSSSIQGLPVESSPASANYGLGYANFKQENFSNAATYFGKTITSLKSSGSGFATLKSSIYPDAVLRLADCSFMNKDYSKALSLYNEVTSNKYAGTDYAYFQKGMLHGIKDELSAKITSLKRLTTDYPKSFYYDDGLYQLASTYLLQKSNSKAIENFEKIIREKPTSPYVLQSLMKLALVYYNSNEDTKAVQYYSRVANNYPGTPEASDALTQVKSISIAMGDPDLYLKLKGADLTEQDSIEYEIASAHYFKNDYPKAKTELGHYLREFPDGYYALQAHYYRADCYYREKDYLNALVDYEYVIDHPDKGSFAEISYLRAAKVEHFVKKNLDKAYLYYEPVYPISTNETNKFEALEGLMETAYKTGRLEQAIQYAQIMIDNEKATQENLIDAHYYMAKTALAREDFSTAMTHFKSTKDLTGNEKGVESRYQIAYLHFRNGDLGQAESACDDLIKNHPSYAYWNVSSLILISDIFVEQEEYFQAKGTLESIVSSYTGDETLLNIAKAKLDAVIQIMDDNSRIKGPEDDPFNDEENE